MSDLHPDLQPFVPTSKDPFDAIKAAHLLNRAGFGGTRAEITRLAALGPQAAIDELLSFSNQTAKEQDPKDLPDLSALDNYPDNQRELSMMYVKTSPEERMKAFQMFQMANRTAMTMTADWWVKRMAKAAHPLQEKLTLFWHGHFTTSAKDERQSKLMWAQNEQLRKHAAGNFASFVKWICRDPAMLDYLNNQQNRRAHPNENFARELMELFTLGIGHYTEDDIKNAARAFTGWGHNGAEFIFREFDHDDDAKTFMGKTGNFDGDDIVDIILKQPACPKHIASRLWNFFVSETADDAITDSLGRMLVADKYDLRGMLRTMFTSRAFYSEKVVGTQIKSPIQLIIGLVRGAEIKMPPGRNLFLPNGPLAQMGQTPFFPPNVKGWPGGRAWINTSTLFVRYNTCIRLAGDVEPEAFATGEAAVDHWLSRLIQRPVDADQRKTLIDAAGAKPDRDSVRRTIQLIVSMPEYQLC